MTWRADDSAQRPSEHRALAGAARLIVRLILVFTMVGAVALTAYTTRPPSATAYVVFFVVLCWYAVSLTWAGWTAVLPNPPARQRRWALWSGIASAGALWGPAFAWSSPGDQPWAWAMGFGVAILPLVTSRRGAVALVVAIIGGCVIGAMVHDGSVAQNLVILSICAAMVLLMIVAAVWLVRLLTTAEDTRELRAELAVTQERLRMTRELHDTLGHRLGVIALEAELATGLVEADPAQARDHTEHIQELASRTMREARQAILGSTVVDLPSQAASARLVLESAGIEVRLDVDQHAALTEQQSRLAAAVVREAVTNVLRHARADRAEIVLVDEPDALVLSVTNDHSTSGSRVVDDAVGGGTGLSGLIERSAAQGCLLIHGPTADGGFRVALRMPPGG